VDRESFRLFADEGPGGVGKLVEEMFGRKLMVSIMALLRRRSVQETIHCLV
jgi:hypothetical protein